MSDIISLGLWIKRRRKALDLTQAELAQRVSCSLDLIQKIEADARRPSREMAGRIADMLELADAERAPFIQAARAELGADRLAPPTQSIARGAFVPSQAAESQPAPTVTPAPPLPSGTVTFLFTDIEGSTQLWEQHPQAMPPVIERHNAILSAAIATHGGTIFKLVGDAVYAAFASAPAALAAALAAQRALHAEAWGATGALLVRMALHTGSAAARDGDYLGLPLNRIARLLAAGHGGQVLLSLATEQLVREHLPPAAALHDLGTHRLKDLSMPEQIFQLVAPGLPTTFPALNTLDARRTNLSAQPTPLIGRERELAQVGTLLRQPEVRMVTLTGPGGIGKTRLGLQLAAELIEDFAHGVYFVDLAPIREPAIVISAIAQISGMREIGNQPLLAQLKQFLGDKHMLLLLDNFEQVLDAAPLLADLLASASRLKLLVTSREGLHLRGGKEVAVPPLALPDRAALPPLDQLSQYAAVALFIQRAVDARSDFHVTNANAAAVAEICARLDGLPLAIELAAARSKLFPPEALLARLSSRLALLTGGARDLPARQQTLRHTIAWSYDLLNDDEQTLFRRLGVFVGGGTLAAIEQVLRTEGQEPDDNSLTSLLDPQSSILDGLAALVDKSLVWQVEVVDHTIRFVMLETIREYALERLAASDEVEQLRHQHALYYLSMVETDPDLQQGRVSAERLKVELDNLRSALAWSQTAANGTEIGLRLTSALEEFWVTEGYWSEACGWISGALMRAPGLDRKLQARLLRDLGQLLALQNDYAAARVKLTGSLLLYRELGDKSASAEVLERLGWLAREQDDVQMARAYLEESLELYRGLGQKDELAGTLNTLGEVAVMQEDIEMATALLEESRAVNQDPVSLFTLAWTLNHLGHIAQLQGEYGRATRLHEESLTLFRNVGNRWLGTAQALHCLGETALAQGNVAGAQEYLIVGLAQFRELGDLAGVGWCLAGFGSAAALDEEPERAARLWGAAEQLRQAIGCRPAPATRATYERAMATTRAQLGEAAFAAAWAEGRALPLEQVIAEALNR